LVAGALAAAVKAFQNAAPSYVGSEPQSSLFSNQGGLPYIAGGVILDAIMNLLDV
jgi:hypothetical protein